jgi:plasmid stabilization system protein ParE
MKDYEVYLSPLAELKLDLLLQYLDLNWGTMVRNKFLSKLKQVTGQLLGQPEIFPESQIKKGIRKCVVTAQTSLYYRIRNETIEIITIIDNRQDPKKTIKEIEEYFEDR